MQSGPFLCSQPLLMYLGTSVRSADGPGSTPCSTRVELPAEYSRTLPCEAQPAYFNYPRRERFGRHSC